MSQNDQLQQAVLAELRWEPSVTAAHIGVTADAGVVSLTGHVDSVVEKLAAEAAAWRVRGVKAVTEEIGCGFPSTPHAPMMTLRRRRSRGLPGMSRFHVT